MRVKEDDYRKAILSVSAKIYDGEIPATGDMDILVWATKKQIGRKVVISEKYNSDRCPRCNYVVYRSNHYCSECGQKLDWRR